MQGDRNANRRTLADVVEDAANLDFIEADLAAAAAVAHIVAVLRATDREGFGLAADFIERGFRDA